MKIILIPLNQTMAARHYRLAKSLESQGHEIHYFMWALPYGISAYEMIKHFFTSLIPKDYKHGSLYVHKSIRLPYFWPIINGWIFKHQLRKLYNSIGADFIITETFTNETEVPKDLPFIYDIADDYSAMADVYGSPIYKFAYKLLDVKGVMERQSKNAIAVTAVSDILVNYAKEFNDNVTKLPNGVDKNIIEKTLNTQNKDINNHSIVYASAFEPWSRVIETLEAVSKLRKEFPDIDLTLIGSGRESEKIQQYICDNQAEGYIHYLGYIYDHDELFSLLNNAAIGLNISDKNKWRDASHPMKVMDYSALGKKVVSTNLNEVEALGFRNIYLFSDDSKKNTFTKVLRRALLDNNTYPDISKKVLDDYSWDKLTNELVELGRPSEKKMNDHTGKSIVHVTSVYPPKLGGLEKVVEELAKAQNDRRENVSVVTSNQDTGSETLDDSIPVDRLKSFVIANTTIIPKLFRQLMKIESNTLVHLHIAQAFTPEMVWIASKIKGFKYVAHVHLDVAPSGAAGFLLKVYKPLILGRVLRAAKFVVVFTKEQKVNIGKRYHINLDRIKIIPNGVADQFFLTKKRTLHKKPRLLFVGRLNIQKNPKLLLEALNGVSDKFETTIVGDGDLEDELKSTSKELRLKNVRFVGRVDGPELINYYKRADIFVLPSEREGMPLVLLEAMAAGLPIVATDVTGNRDVVKKNKNGLLVPYGNPLAFQKALIKITSDKIKFNSMSESARKLAKQYSWRKVAEDFNKLYKVVQRKQKAKSGIPLPIVLIPLLIIANIAYLVPGITSSIITLVFFLLIPGYLLLRLITHEITNRWEVAGLSMVLSLFILIMGGLLLNCLAAIGLSKPLQTVNIFIMLDVITLTLIIFRRSQRFIVPTQMYWPAKSIVVASTVLTMLPLIAIAGAVRLNNGASNILTMLLFGLIGIVMIMLLTHTRLKKLYPYAIFTIGLSLLLCTSFRGWVISGHDIIHEFQVFQATSSTGIWQIITSNRDPYNACLSITILPTILKDISHIPALYIFKIVIQFIFALGLIPLYFLAKRLGGKSRIALLSAFLFVLYPPFLNDMPYLNRQEIALTFYIAAMSVAFMQISYRAKTIVTAIFLAGIVVSHYSTSYVTLGILGLAWLTYKLITIRRCDLPERSIPLLNIWLIFGMLASVFLWNTVITQTSHEMGGVAQKAIATIQRHDFDWAKSLDHSLLSISKQEPQQIINNYVNNDSKKVTYSPDANLPLTTIGNLLTHIIPIKTLNDFTRGMSSKLIELLLIVGIVLLYFKSRKSSSQGDIYLLTLTISGVILLAMIVLLPYVSGKYSVTRIFQQVLVFGSVPIVLAMIKMFSFTKRYRWHVTGGLLVILFWILTGFLPQITGGYPPQLALNNAGTYYDIYYQHPGERASASWMEFYSNGLVIVDMDDYARLRFPNFPLQTTPSRNPALSTNPDDYLYQDSANKNRGVYGGFISGVVLQYTLNDEKDNRNLIYVNQDSSIYGPIVKH